MTIRITNIIKLNAVEFRIAPNDLLHHRDKFFSHPHVPRFEKILVVDFVVRKRLFLLKIPRQDIGPVFFKDRSGLIRTETQHIEPGVHLDPRAMRLLDQKREGIFLQRL